MELGADLAQRLEDLGGQHDDGQTVEERDIAENQAHTDLDGDERDRQGRQKLQDAARQEGDAQGRHRGLRVGLPELAQVSARALLPAQSPQGGQARHEVQKLGGQTFHGLQLVLGGGLSEAADEDHEDGDERDDEEGDECRPEVQEENDPQGRGRHSAHEHQLREEGNEVGAQVLQSRG